MGYVYLLQPAELVGTSRYKIGISSKDNLNRLRSYGCGTRYIFFLECEDFFGIERILKREFAMEKEIRLIKGKEYFEGEEKTILKIFMRVMWREKIADLCVEEVGDLKEDTLATRTDISFSESINKFKFKH